jgi:hypothetical protein
MRCAHSCRYLSFSGRDFSNSTSHTHAGCLGAEALVNPPLRVKPPRPNSHSSNVCPRVSRKLVTFGRRPTGLALRCRAISTTCSRNGPFGSARKPNRLILSSSERPRPPRITPVETLISPSFCPSSMLSPSSSTTNLEFLPNAEKRVPIYTRFTPLLTPCQAIPSLIFLPTPLPAQASAQCLLALPAKMLHLQYQFPWQQTSLLVILKHLFVKMFLLFQYL